MKKKNTLIAILFFTISNVSAAYIDKLNLPKGFNISIYADELPLPRQIAESESGYIFFGSKVQRDDKGRIHALIDKDKDGYAEEKIITSPLLNIEEIKPSFEEFDDENETLNLNQDLKEKKNILNLKSSQAILIGLDKITAKSSKLIVNLNETKKFGPLEIKILKCGKVKVDNKTDSVAYMQVKDLTKNENEQVFIFNGWTFASDPSLTPFDHAIYDLQLLNCNKA